MEVSTAAVMVRVVEPLILPELAVIVELPVATPVARPPVLTVAIEVDDEVQTAALVRFCVVPLL
jgi:hypothetical protein